MDQLVKEIIFYHFQITDNLKLFHWLSDIAVHHTATGDFLKDWDDLMDSFIESLQGRIGRLTEFNNVEIKLTTPLSVDEVKKLILTLINVMEDFQGRLRGDESAASYSFLISDIDVMIKRLCSYAYKMGFKS